MKTACYEVFKGDDGLWRYRLVANSTSPGLREVMHVSQGYQSGRRGAMRGAQSAKRAAATAAVVVVEG